MRRTGSPKGSPHFLSAGKFIVRHAVPHDWKTRLNALHLWAGGGASIMLFSRKRQPTRRVGGSLGSIGYVSLWGVKKTLC